MSDVGTAATVQLARPLGAGAVFADRYEIVSVLGQGGMGTVYRARDLELSEDVALKILRPEVAEAPTALDRFRREVKLARRVTHPNVARTFDLGSFGGSKFLTMELIVGAPLGRVVGRARKVPMADALRIASEIARGLGAAHAVGVVHRDLKPENVLVTTNANTHEGALDGRVVITDFGIARLADGVREGTHVRGVTGAGGVGTPAYMAPEQVEGHELDGRADVYALGVVLFELLTGTLPFHGDTPFAMAAARIAADPPDPRSIDASIPEGVARIVLDAMARTRDKRPDTQSLLQRLDAARGIVASVADQGPLPSLFVPGSSRPESLGTRTTAIDLAQGTPIGPRSVAVAPFDFGGDDPLARDLVASLADALSKMRGVRVLTPASVRASAGLHVVDGTLDAAGLGKTCKADLVVDGSLRAVSGRVRLRVRLVDVAKGVQVWADRFEGSIDDAFALEDALVRATTEAVRARTSEAALLGPTNPEARDVWERAKAEYGKFLLPHVRQAIALLEDGYLRFPDDPWIGSALGAALVRAWMQTGAVDRSMFARAEEVTLRALAADATIGETFNTIAHVRLAQGELRATVRALHDALARAPLLAEAHLTLGRLLAESGHVDEGSRRVDVSLRLDPKSIWSYMERARIAALLGDRERAQVDLERALAIGGPASIALQSMRLAIWWNDKALALKVAQAIEDAKTGSAYEVAPPLLRSWVEGKVHPKLGEVFDKLVSQARASPRHRMMMLQIGAEQWAAHRHSEEAFAMLEQAAELPMTDLLWLDRAPTLDFMRDDPRFARVRSVVAARVAELWG